MSFILFDSPLYERTEIPSASPYDYAVSQEINVADEPAASYAGSGSRRKSTPRKSMKLSRTPFSGSWDYSEVD